jgi:undecaprenyl-phosphate 4-deoxy-4-formamido-L-arabinose transferase
VREAFATYGSPYVSIDVLLTWGTTKFSAISLRHAPRARGESNYTALSLLRHALNMMTGFSTAPLRFANIVGLVFTVFGGLVLVYVVGRYLIQGSSVAGFPFLASIIAIFAGAQLFALGIIGEYLARMHGRLMERPTYVVQTDDARQ